MAHRRFVTDFEQRLDGRTEFFNAVTGQTFSVLPGWLNRVSFQLCAVFDFFGKRL